MFIIAGNELGKPCSNLEQGCLHFPWSYYPQQMYDESNYSPFNYGYIVGQIVVFGGDSGVMVIVVGNGHGNMSSNPE